ncbi:serine hydrolase domain-containing protein [Rhodoferax mekongensis]|uniref:Serine hydrolase domain-containing protein n=1 Tax=Rhodoferax mekongensis TaxID=3068341 RepID=A0ABZ0AZ65_9BURK|nr:serine hydrolase domain-containing protein [Rhodoferax sp. TBRC 17307]WNO04441.1 serine hydrolase domain-containing protein [Rhodoferax sp. TBRC 17307]
MTLSPGFHAPALRNLEQVLQAEVDKGRLPGAVALVARHGQIVLHSAIGQQNPAGGTPMAVDSIFRIYSMTKPLVSVAIMQLLERGQLLLSDPVGQHLSEFADVRVAEDESGRQTRPPARPPTVQDLLRHTSGLTYEILGDDPIQQRYAQAGLGTRMLSNTGFSQALSAIPYRYEPGSIWQYSRATDLLGALLERVTGMALGDYLQAHILGPLGMVDTAFVVLPDKQHRIAEPFAHDPDGGVPMPLMDLRKTTPMQAGGAGLGSTAADYARFLQCMLNGGTLNGARILSPASVRLMTSDHLGDIPVNRSGRAAELLPPGHGFGLGFAVRLEEGLGTQLGSKGMYYWSGISGTVFFVDPAKDLFAILLTQAPNQRSWYRPLFRNLVYAALND